MTKLSVNVNKIATLRNSRGGNNPNVAKVAQDCERFGADGITVHPRPDERHIRYQDVLDLKKVVTTEFNIEGYPDERYMELVLKVKPTQATLVPDPPTAITSDNGWDTVKNKELLKEIIGELKKNDIRVSIFVNADEKMVEGAAETGTDRIELYTGPYAYHFHQNQEKAIENYIKAAHVASHVGLGINAGHDLDLHNLKFFYTHIKHLAEVSIGHALIADALYLGLENTIQLYKRCLQP
jgi:pyridoxine 5-phosphate synthase